jgi:hypothetical protein
LAEGVWAGFMMIPPYRVIAETVSDDDHKKLCNENLLSVTNLEEKQERKGPRPDFVVKKPFFSLK